MRYLDTSLALLAQQIPGATAIFNRYQLSFCCGGKSTLKQAIAEAKLDQNEILSALSQLNERSDNSTDWHNLSDQALISELVENFHPIYSTLLSELVRLAERVETVHGDSPNCPSGLAHHLKQLMIQVEAYLLKEQDSLFPALLSEQKLQASEIIQSILQDQDELTLGIDKIDDLTNGIITPKGACNTWRALYSSLITFKDDLFQQFLLENKFLFSRNLICNDTASTETKTEAKNQADKKEAIHGEDFCCGSCGGS